MFDKRLMQVCPESKKYIIGNILLQWLELFMNAVMILTIANAVDCVCIAEGCPSVHRAADKPLYCIHTACTHPRQGISGTPQAVSGETGRAGQG